MRFAIVLLAVLGGSLWTSGVAAADQLPVDAYMTPEGAHLVGGPACAPGYTTVGSVADCGGGSCSGNQRMCVRFLPLDQIGLTTSIVRDLFLTQEGKHKAGGPGCPAGYTPRGSVADCGGGWCFGNQVLCVKSAPLISIQGP